LNVILGRAERLSGAVADELRPDVESIREIGESLLELSEKVRTLSPVQEWSANDEVTININDRIDAILDAVRTEYPDVTIDYDDATHEPVETRISDEEFFDLALENLIENSIIHNDLTDPRVSVTLKSEDGVGWVRVVDNGPGLPDYERRVLANGTETDLQHSSGIGLWLVYWCVDELGGDVQFATGDPTGTVVTVEIPI
jgi:signal transduction histidine kinase